MIETAVMRGIKDMETDPERSARRLTDLGRQFAKNRFEDNIFSVIQELLDNEHSAYYDMIHSLLRNCDHEAMKQFRVNFGYMSWVYGAGKIRKMEAETGRCIPWAVMLRHDSSRQDGLAIDEISQMIEQGQTLGIYAWFIRQSAESPENYEMLGLLERYKDCAFVWIKENGRLTAAQIQMLKVCKNTVVSLPVSDQESLLTCALLRDQKIPFAMHTVYNDEKEREDTSMEMEAVLASETAMFFLVQGDQSKISRRQKCYDARLRQDSPFLIMDYYGDARRLAQVLTEHDDILEIDVDGRILKPASAAGMLFPKELPFPEALGKVMPAKQ